MTDTGQRAYFDAIAAAFGARYDTRPAFQERLALFVAAGRAALQDAAAPARPLCLDLGCGPGAIALSLARAGYDVTGVDSSAAMIGEARAAALHEGLRLAGAASGSCTFLEEDLAGYLARTAGEAKPWLIVCSSVLEYLAEPEPVLRAMARRLAPGGTLLVSLPNRRSVLRALEPLAQRLVPRGSRYLDRLENRLAVPAAVAVARECGLVCESARHFGFPNLARAALQPFSARASVGTLTLLRLVRRQGARPLRIYVNATSARLGGGITVLRNLLPALTAQDGGRHLYTVAASAGIGARLDPRHARVALVTRRLAGPALRLAWEQAALPLEARAADVIFEPAGVASLFAPTPQVLMVQNFAPFDAALLARAPPRHRARLLLLRALTIRSARRARSVLFISQFARDRILPLLGIDSARARTVYPGRDPAFSPQASARTGALLARLGVSQPYLLCVSQFYFYKNLVELVRGFALARAALPKDALLLLAGEEHEPDYARRVRAAALDAGVEDRVRFLGQVAYDDLPPLYAGASLFLFPSTCENFPNILVEALASGAPTLSSRLGPMPEIAGDAALYFDPFDPADIASCIARALRDPAALADLGARGVLRAARYSWEDAARGVLAALEEAAG